MKKSILRYILRVGMIAKGIIYLAIGAIALRVAAGGDGEAESAQGALDEIGRQPFGNVALVVLFLGLLHYSAWRVAQGVLDPEEMESKPYGRWFRIWSCIVGIAHLFFAYQIISRVIQAWGLVGGEDDGEAVRSWTSAVLEWPGGRWLVGLSGLAAFCVCVAQLIYAYKANFAKALHSKRTGRRARAIMIWLGRIGLGARSVIAAIIGIFFVHVMLTEDPNDAGGVSDALQSLLQQPFGPWLLGATALGLMCIGFFFWGLGRYQKLEKDPLA